MLFATAAVVISVAGVLTACEIGLRVYHFLRVTVYDRSLPPLADRCLVPSGDPELIYELNPGWNMEGFHVNSHGMADKEVTFEKPPGVVRIAFVGDSITCNFRLARRDEVYLEVLERRLNSVAPNGVRYECLNFGVNGYGILQDVRMIQSRVFRFHPDVIVVQLCLNDPYPSDTPYTRGTLREGWRTWNLVSRLLRPARFCGRLAVDRCYDAQGVHHVDEALTALAGEARKGTPVLLVLFPYLYRPAYVEWDYRRFHDLYRREAERESLPFLDLHDAFDRKGIIDDRWPKDPLHPGPEGHRVAAEEILRELQRRSMLVLDGSAGATKAASQGQEERERVHDKLRHSLEGIPTEASGDVRSPDVASRAAVTALTPGRTRRQSRDSTARLP